MESSSETKLKLSSSKKEVNDEQMYSAMSFAVMLVLVGIPLWWKTTEVYRASLPYSEIDELTDNSFLITITVHVATLDKARGDRLVEDLNSYFANSRVYNASIIQHSVPKQLLGSCKSLSEVELKVSHPKNEGSIQLFEVPGLSRFTQRNVIVGENRTIFFSTDADAALLYNVLQSRVLAEDHLNRTIMHVKGPPEGRLDAECSQRVSPAKAFDVLLTVLNPEPEKTSLEFDLPKAVQAYLDPLIEALSDLNEFHVKSQWLYLVNLEVKPKLMEGDVPHYALAQSMLPHVITPLEKKLGSQVSKNPCLNLVLWVPPCTISPLFMYSDTGRPSVGSNAFISPRWGGIQIFNPPSDECELASRVTVRPDMTQVMPVFVQQIRLLLGLPSLLDDVASGHVTPSTVYVRSWEKDYLLRSRTVEQMTIAKHTLQSLSKLLGKINNIVINDNIGEAIYGSLSAIRSCEEALASGRLLDGYRFSQEAFLSSEAAFSDPSLLALLYFPEDQKYAVYIPLFLPVMIPVLISFKPLREWVVKKLLQTPKPKTD